MSRISIDSMTGRVAIRSARCAFAAANSAAVAALRASGVRPARKPHRDIHVTVAGVAVGDRIVVGAERAHPNAGHREDIQARRRSSAITSHSPAISACRLQVGRIVDDDMRHPRHPYFINVLTTILTVAT